VGLVIALIRMRLADGPLRAALTANSRLGQPVKWERRSSSVTKKIELDSEGHFIVALVDIF
jgi:hypothetical protein